ncbi:hypothetical protein N4G58_14330 [Edwardsiella piscicida]|nr:hypothetical protein N4G58_14330 [Edwardsiella piscicida]
MQKTGMSLPFQKDIYYPENDTIGPPRLLSPKDAADKIIEIYLHGVDDYKKTRDIEPKNSLMIKPLRKISLK